MVTEETEHAVHEKQDTIAGSTAKNMSNEDTGRNTQTKARQNRA